MGQCHGADTALAIEEAGCQFRIAEFFRLQVKQARYYLQVILDPMMDFLQEHFLFFQRSAQLFFGMPALAYIPMGMAMSIMPLPQRYSM